MSASTQWQLAHEAAERYESILVPAILGPFAKALVNWSGLCAGETVLDVGCGTGTAARYAAEQVGASGRVIGVDVNEGMLEVARSISARRGDSIQWQQGDAAHLVFDDGIFDIVLCAQSLQFLPERLKALREMRRVARPHGRVAISLWSGMEQNLYFHALIDAVTRHIGPETAAGLKAIFNLSDAAEIRALTAEAGFEKVSMSEIQLDLSLPPLREFIPRHVSATPMAAGFASASSGVREAVLAEMGARLASFTTDAGVLVPFRSYLVMAE